MIPQEQLPPDPCMEKTGERNVLIVDPDAIGTSKTRQKHVGCTGYRTPECESAPRTGNSGAGDDMFNGMEPKCSRGDAAGASGGECSESTPGVVPLSGMHAGDASTGLGTSTSTGLSTSLWWGGRATLTAKGLDQFQKDGACGRRRKKKTIDRVT